MKKKFSMLLISGGMFSTCLKCFLFQTTSPRGTVCLCIFVWGLAFSTSPTLCKPSSIHSEIFFSRSNLLPLCTPNKRAQKLNSLCLAVSSAATNCSTTYLALYLYPLIVLWFKYLLDSWYLKFFFLVQGLVENFCLVSRTWCSCLFLQWFPGCIFVLLTC